MSSKKLKTWKKTAAKKLKKINWKKVLPIGLIVYVVVMCGSIAVNTRYNSSPDEGLKYFITQYVSEEMDLPRCDEPRVMGKGWGVSYACKPFVAYAISGVIVHFVSKITSNFRWHVVAARSIYVIFIALYAFMILRISKKCFKGVFRGLFVVLAALIPQVLYFGGYMNNDSLALMATGVIIYGWLLGLESKWSWKSCAVLGVGLGICALSYYNALGYLVCSAFIFIATMIADKHKFGELLKKGFAILGIVLALSGWFYVRNALLYNGDAFDMHTSTECAEKNAAETFKPSKRTTPKKQGQTVWEMVKGDWGRSTIQSTFGYFGYMDHPMRYWDYMFYEGVFLIGLLGTLAATIYLIYYLVKKKRRTVKDKLQIAPSTNFKMSKKSQRIFHITMIAAIIIPIALAIFFSFACDYSPQGRYIMPALVPVVYYVTYGYKFLVGDSNKTKQRFIIGLIIGIAVFLSFYAIVKYVLPEFPWH